MAPSKRNPGAGDAGARKSVLVGTSNSSENNAFPVPRQAPRGGRRSRDKGNRVERHLVRLLQDAGFGAERIPLSGSAGGKFSGDLSVPLLGIDRTVEVKCRARGFAQIYDWLADHSFLIVKSDRKPPLVVIPLRLALEFATAAERTPRASSPGPTMHEAFPQRAEQANKVIQNEK
jgi:hypothetical protein